MENWQEHSRLIKAGMARAAEQGRRAGRRPGTSRVTNEQIRAVIHLGTGAGAAAVGLSTTQFRNRRNEVLAEDAKEPSEANA